MKLKIRYEGFINQLLILIVILLLIPIGLTVYLFHVVHATELGMIKTQQDVMENAMDYLDRSLDGSFESVLAGLHVENLPTRDQEKALNQALKPIVDRAREKYPNLELGYYSKDFDVILDGDNLHLHENFSTRRKRNFDEAMENRNSVFEILGQSESSQIETYRPLVRDGKVIGAVWASKNAKQIYRTVDEMRQVFYGLIIIGVLLGFGGAFSLINKFARSVNEIKKGLQVISKDPTFIIPRGSGELGEITDAVNDMFKKLIDVQNHNDLILSSIDDGIVAIDKNERVISFNPAAERMFGLDESCLGRNINDVFNGGSPFALYLVNTLSEDKPVKDVDVIYNHPRDGSRNLLISTSLMVNVRRELIGAQLHVRDITEKVRLQESINKQERLASLGKLVAGVAHEIRSPLTSINGYIQFWNKGNVPSLKSLKIVNREMNRLSTITDQLLEFARPARAVFEECDLNSLVKRSIQFFADSHEGAIDINCSFEQNLPTAMIDSRQIEQVLSNVLYNAYQAMNGRGRLEISTWLDGDHKMLGVAVKDNGCGIPEEVIPNLFEPFFTTKSKGTGLGLAIAHEIMEAHNGFIRVESKLNQGTTVNIFLPVAKEVKADGKSAYS
ncbi:MAG: two-component system sensor histidine kinase AtoS [Peptococcaceae bacterium]|nr:two-component system sensor histidine kinase AtoS [Peptococcaceae bacterium]